ncbi:MAG TPA: hypothetical protein ENN17_01570 [bacterium]|nr:hypothetical protein [bacterium]
MKRFFVHACVLMVAFIYCNCIKNSPAGPEDPGEPDAGIMTGNDGTVYTTVKIGDRWWLAENLRETLYRNGDGIANVTDPVEWEGLTTGARCVYEKKESNTEICGYLYNRHVVNDSRNIAPEGWCVPTDEDWKALDMVLGMSREKADQGGYRGTEEGSKLAGDAESWNSGALKSDPAFGRSGFSALPGGCRNISGGGYFQLGNHAYFWSGSTFGTQSAWYRHEYPGVIRSYTNKRNGFSVRLVLRSTV